MSASPPKETDVEQGAQSGDDPEHMESSHQDPHGQVYDFEVKEQDRWLPIANGRSPFFFSPFESASTLYHTSSIWLPSWSRIDGFACPTQSDLRVPYLTLLLLAAWRGVCDLLYWYRFF